jgi:hypothetical protein
MSLVPPARRGKLPGVGIITFEVREKLGTFMEFFSPARKKFIPRILPASDFLIEMLFIYLIVSLIGIIINYLVIITYGQNYTRLAVYILTTLLYIPILFYFYHRGEYKRIQQAVSLTVLVTIIYILMEGIIAFYSILITLSGTY